MLRWAIADKMTRLYTGKFPDPDEGRGILTALQILQTYPSDGFARSGQSVMKC